MQKFEANQYHQSIDESKATFLRQQFRVIEELRDLLKALKIKENLNLDLKKQRIDQTKDFIDALYDKKIYNQLLCAAELRITAKIRQSTRSYQSGFDKKELTKKKDKLEKELQLIKALLEF